MKLFDKIQSWPNEKKTTFSVITAIIITILIVAAWFGLKPKIDVSQPATETNNKAIDSLKESFQKISEDFNAIKGQLFGTTTNATSSQEASTTNN